MANTRLLFLEQNGEVKHLECYYDIDSNNIVIMIDGDNIEASHIFLDKNTSIKLSKTIKSEISKIESNG